MNDEIGMMAGAIWRALDANGAMTVAMLKKELKAPSSLFDWAIGWLAREDKIVLTRQKRSVFVSLKGMPAKSAHAA